MEVVDYHNILLSFHLFHEVKKMYNMLLFKIY